MATAIPAIFAAQNSNSPCLTGETAASAIRWGSTSRRFLDGAAPEHRETIRHHWYHEWSARVPGCDPVRASGLPTDRNSQAGCDLPAVHRQYRTVWSGPIIVTIRSTGYAGRRRWLDGHGAWRPAPISNEDEDIQILATARRQRRNRTKLRRGDGGLKAADPKARRCVSALERSQRRGSPGNALHHDHPRTAMGVARMSTPRYAWPAI